MSISVIIADDERAAREELKLALQSFPDMRLIGEARHADEARALMDTAFPDLLLLDIHMPGESGFELLASLARTPHVIFTTAFDQYAIKAFEVNALDYLLKPVRHERFAQAMEKARLRINETTPPDRQVFVKDGDTCHFVKLSSLYLIESMDNYSRLYFDGKKACLKRSLNQWETQLDERFFRINRTQIINLSYIEHIQTLPQSRIRIRLRSGEEMDVSGRQSAKFRTLDLFKKL